MDREKLFRQRAVAAHSARTAAQETLQPPSLWQIRGLWGVIAVMCVLFGLSGLIRVPDYAIGYWQTQEETHFLVLPAHITADFQPDRALTLQQGENTFTGTVVALENEDAARRVQVRLDSPTPPLNGAEIDVLLGETTLLALWVNALREENP